MPDIILMETGEIIENAIVSKSISPNDMTDKELAEYLNKYDNKLKYIVTFNEYCKLNINNIFDICEILVDKKGNTEYKIVGIFYKLVYLTSHNYKNSIQFNSNENIWDILSISKATYYRYLDRFQKENLAKIIKYNNVKYLVINPFYCNRGNFLSAPVFIAFKEELKKYLNPYVFEYFYRIYECGDYIPIKTPRAKI